MGSYINKHRYEPCLAQPKITDCNLYYYIESVHFEDGKYKVKHINGVFNLEQAEAILDKMSNSEHYNNAMIYIYTNGYNKKNIIKGFLCQKTRSI